MTSALPHRLEETQEEDVVSGALENTPGMVLKCVDLTHEAASSALLGGNYFSQSGTPLVKRNTKRISADIRELELYIDELGLEFVQDVLEAFRWDISRALSIFQRKDLVKRVPWAESVDQDSVTVMSPTVMSKVSAVDTTVEVDTVSSSAPTLVRFPKDAQVTVE